MVLRGYLDASGLYFLDGMVSAVVSEGHFFATRAEGKGEELKAEANAKDGYVSCDQGFEHAIGVECAGGWVAGSV